MSAQGEATPPLSGTRVLDLSSRYGAYCSKILADLGADVVKVELPTGDRLRQSPPWRDGSEGSEASLMFAYYHHNKRGISLDWQRDEAQPLLGELASWSDVVLASPKGERVSVAGFSDGNPTLTWVPADVVICFLTPFGLTGPYRDWRATPLTSFAMSGYMHPVGPTEGPPVAMPGQQFCDEAGLWGAFLIQSILRASPRLRDQVIDLSVHEVGWFNKLGTEQYGLSGNIKTRATNFGPPPGGIWKCRDGLLDIGAHAAHHWDIFVDLLGRPDVLSDPIYRQRSMRIQLYDLLTELIADLLADRSATEFVAAGQAAGLPCALTQTPSEFLGDPQPKARGFFIPSTRKGTGTFAIPGAPFHSAPSLHTFDRSAPSLGEANHDVYVDALGHSEEELDRWRADGLI